MTAGPNVQSPDRAQQPVFSRERLIRFSDCDPAGIVFYPQYFVMTNGLVEDWFNEGLGIEYAGLIARRRIGLPIVHLETDFKTPGLLGERMLLSLTVERLGERSITLTAACTGQADGRLRMSARFVLVTTSLETHESVPLPADVAAAIRMAIASPA
jgi:4-hydroxybenzoyl-CoA thioesterase